VAAGKIFAEDVKVSLPDQASVDRGKTPPAAADPGNAEEALGRAEWQAVIYAQPPTRAALLQLHAGWRRRRVRLQVLRNQPFEYVASVLHPFLAFAGLDATIDYSDYDDSLAGLPHPDADAVIVWLDFERYGRLSSSELADWLAERLQRVRAVTNAPILVSNWGAMTAEADSTNESLHRIASRIPGLSVMDQAALARDLGGEYRDERMARLAGTTMSDRASLATAYQLGLSWLPAALEPAVKAIVVDLDGTLYEGVLAEDGPAGLRLTAAHRALQESLLDLRRRGIFLAAVSRNELRDVVTLFRERPDFPIRQDHFSALQVSWSPKADGIRKVAAALRIGPEAILYLDDNPGELAAVASALDNVRTFHAADPALTRRALGAFPGLFRWAQTETDSLRVHDLAASQRREEILGDKRGSAPSYLASLQVEIDVTVDQPSHLQRLHELSQKTNQFNTGLLRLTAADISGYLQKPDHHAVSIGLRDRLSDSGLVGACFLHLLGELAVVDEIAISCRALGRGIEELMILAALYHALAGRAVASVVFAFKPGPRNDPARTVLAQIAVPDGDVGGMVMRWHPSEVERQITTAAVRWTVSKP
jgi:FkbH-like protein